MNHFLLLLSLATSLISHRSEATWKPHSALPRNHLRIPVHSRFASEMTRAEFEEILHKLRETHELYFTQQGARLRIKADWNDAAVNAFADRDGQTYILEILGGLARYPTLTRDGFTLLVCHEMGHHLGGAPTGMNLGWPSVEGQSDYFSTLKCLRRMFSGQDSEPIVRAQAKNLEPKLIGRCQRAFPQTNARYVCLRSALAALSAAQLLHELDGRGPVPSFLSVDENVVKKTNASHPQAQCRLDTLVAGAVCPADHSSNPDVKDPTVSVCFERRDSDGFRPRCWYKPELRALR